MDKSETYIKMSDHPLIQEQWEIRGGQPGDFLFFKCENEIGVVCGVRHCDMSSGYYESEDTIGLFRQDQIQEMTDIKDIDDYREAIFDMFYEVKDEIEYIQPLWRFSNSERFFTPEQLWLAFYMHEKHKLKWEDGKWQ